MEQKDRELLTEINKKLGELQSKTEINNRLSELQSKAAERVPITLEKLETLGFARVPAIIKMFESSQISVAKSTEQHKVISVAHNELDKYYLYVREGDITASRHEDDLVLITSSCQYIDEIDSLYYLMTSQHLQH